MFSGELTMAIYCVPALGREPDIHQLHAIGFGGQLLPVGFQLGVVGDLVVVAEVESQGLFGRGDGGRDPRKHQRNQGECTRSADRS